MRPILKQESFHHLIKHILTLSCGVLNHMWFNLCLPRSAVPKASETPKKEHFWMRSNTCTYVWAQAHLHSQKQRSHFYVLAGQTTLTDHCAEPWVRRAHFLVEPRERTWTVGSIYMYQTAEPYRRLQRHWAARPQKGHRMKPSFWLHDRKQGRDHLYFFESFRGWRVCTRYYLLLQHFRVICQLFRVSKHLQSQFMTKGNKSIREKSLHGQKNKSMTLRDKAA